MRRIPKLRDQPAYFAWQAETFETSVPAACRQEVSVEALLSAFVADLEFGP